VPVGSAGFFRSPCNGIAPSAPFAYRAQAPEFPNVPSPEVIQGSFVRFVLASGDGIALRRTVSVLDPRAVLAIVLLCFELLQETETRRSGREPRSAVLGHAEALLAAMHQLITKRKLCGSFLAPGSHHRGRASCSSPKAQSEGKIALIVKWREAGTVGLREQSQVTSASVPSRESREVLHYF
jgi:hypothetical protein